MVNKTTTPIIARKENRPTTKKRGVIQFHILMRLAYKNLFFKKLRTTLTVMGVVIGIGSIVFLLSFGFGLQDLVNKQVIGSSSVQTIDVTTPRSKILKLNQEVVSQVKGMAGVKTVAKSYNTAGRIKLHGSQTESVVYGVNSEFIDLSSLQFTSGTSLDNKNNDEAVINSSLAKALSISDTSKVKNQKLSVSFDAINSTTGEKKVVTKDVAIQGIYESDARSEVFIPSLHFESAGVTDATQLKVVVDKKDQVAPVRKAIESLGFTTTSPLDTIDQINQFFTLLRFILLGFGGIGMVIAILGMFNTLTISLLERTREIALMISLGARKQDIRRLFFVEALLLSLLGGFLGVLGAVLFGMIGNLVLNTYAHHNGVKEHVSAFVVSPSLAGIILLLSALIGLIVVYFPARRAAQINPIEALHNE